MRRKRELDNDETRDALIAIVAMLISTVAAFLVLLLCCGCRTQKRVTESLEVVERSNNEVRVQNAITRDVTLQNVSFRGERKTVEVIEEYDTDSVGNSSLKRKEMRSIVEVTDGGSSKLVGKQETVSNEEENHTLQETKSEEKSKVARRSSNWYWWLLSGVVVTVIVWGVLKLRRYGWR